MTGLLQGNTALQALTMGPLPDLTPTVTKSLAAMIQKNQHLIHLELELSKMLSDSTSKILAQALHTKPSRSRTCSLQIFVLSSHRLGRVSKTCQAAFLDMIQHNFSLKKCVLFRKNFLQDKLSYYTRLNKLGRHTMLRLVSANSKTETKPEDIWMRVLGHEEIRHDLDAIYYLLSNNPALCTHTLTPTTNNKRQPDGVASTNDVQQNPSVVDCKTSTLL